jgi:long-chain fatty acid transport protein
MRKLLALLATGTLVTGSAFATNGYFTTSGSTIYKGMGGAGVALPRGVMASAQNPAAGVWVEGGYEIGASYFRPDRNFTVSGAVPAGPPPPGAFPLAPGKVTSGKKNFVIPALGFNMNIDDNQAFSLVIQANGGMNTEYPSAVFGGTSPTGVDLSQLFVIATYARTIDDHSSWGISPIFAMQRFSADGLQGFGAMSSNAANLTNQGHDYSGGISGRVGYFREMNDKWNFGFVYSPHVEMSRFGSYQGLFAEGGDFDIPESWTVGFAFKPKEDLSIAFDIQQINYSDVPSIGNGVAAAQAGIPLGANNGPGFGWDDMTVFKLGAEWVKDERTTFRAGFSWTDQPIPSTEVLFNIVAPAVMEKHLSFGFTRDLTDTRHLDFAVTRAIESDVTGANPFFPGQFIKLEMDQWEVGFALRVEI